MASSHYRYRLLIDMYRSKLLELNEAACMAVDIRAEDLGEGWVCDDDVLQYLDELWPAPAIAKKFGFGRSDIYNWEAAGGFERFETADGPRYRVRDVVSYFARKNRNP